MPLLRKWVKGFKIGGDQAQCIEIMLNKLKETPVWIEEEDKDGATLLMYAAAWGYKDLVEILVWNGFTVSKQDHNGKSALFYSLDSPSDNADVFEFLL